MREPDHWPMKDGPNVRDVPLAKAEWIKSWVEEPWELVHHGKNSEALFLAFQTCLISEYEYKNWEEENG